MKERRKEGRLGRVSDFSAISNKVSQWGILQPKSPGTVLPDAEPLATSSPVLQGKEGSQPRSKCSGRCRGSVSQLCLHSGRFGWHIYVATTGKDLRGHTTQKSRISIASGVAISRCPNDNSTIFLHFVVLLPQYELNFPTGSLHVVVKSP